MKNITIILAAVLSAGAAFGEIAVIPRPVKVVEKEGFFKSGKSSYDEVAKAAAFKEDASIPAEGYRLSVTPQGISIAASDAAGRFYAEQTLKQLGEPCRCPKRELHFPCVEIEDAPRFPYRGAHLDVVRHFFNKETVKRFLDMMAYHKLNRFHIHLTDSQGWRLPIPKYPQLTKKGPSYTEADILEIIAYAEKLHITIVPEIEMPGHSGAAVKALRWLRCDVPGKKKPPRGIGGTLCLGNERTIKFVEDVLDEVCRLFPGELIHIGGDEVYGPGWPCCSRCKARMAKEGAKTQQDYQAWFTAQVSAYLTKKGRRATGWDEIIHNGLVPEGAVVMSWRGKEGAIAAAKAGRDTILSPTSHCYLDYRQNLKGDNRRYLGLNKKDTFVTLEKAYSFNPLEDIPAEHAKHVLGGQFNNWTEYTATEADLQWKVWPRGCALAEVFWSPADGNNFEDFKRRMKKHRERLVAMRVNCATLQ